MSVIGRIGQFMIDYQEVIGAIAFIALVAILVILLIRLIVKNARRKKADAAERDRLMEELIKVSNDNKEILSALAKVTGIDGKAEVEESTAEEPKKGSINEELIKQLESAAGGTVEEVVAKALQTAREYDELTRIKEAHEHAAVAHEVEPETEPQYEVHVETETEPQDEQPALVIEPQPDPAEQKAFAIDEQLATIEQPAIVIDEQHATAQMEMELQAQVAEQINDELQQFTQPEQVQPEQVQPAPQPAQQEATAVEPARAYMSREAAVDKYGNVYTESMLMDQIG